MQMHKGEPRMFAAFSGVMVTVNGEKCTTRVVELCYTCIQT